MKAKFFQLARTASKRSDHKQHKVGAVLVRKNRVLAIGYNKPLKTHPLSTSNYNTVHAELDAILKLEKDKLEGCTIYVYREDCSGKPKIAKPCEHCEKLLRTLKIKQVYYTIDGGSEHYKIG